MAARDPFATVHDALRRDPSVAEMRAFGSLGFKVRDKVFAVFWKGDLVLKLPEERARALLAEKVARPWDPGHGRTMKEWVAFPPRTSARWVKLIAEARDFVAAGSPAPVRKRQGSRAR